MLEEMYARMTIEDEEEGGVTVEGEEIIENTQTFVLVGKFLTEKNINFNAMQNVMASLWRPKEGMEVHDLGGARYSFVFYHPLDLQKVIEGGPWSFEQSMLVCYQVAGNEDLHTVKLHEVDIWIQIYDMPKGFISEKILKSVGDSIGRYVKSDSANFEGKWRDHVRIRVAIDIEKPLKRRMKLKRDGNNWTWINFKYERMSSFCFVCGIIGHSERDCNVVYANPEKPVERAYGAWLRAPTRNSTVGAGAKWLRTAGDNRWAKNNFGTEAATTVQGGKKEEARFMEIDGVVREISGDRETVKVIPRDKGDNEDLNLENNEEREKENDSVNLSGKIVVDPKRRRIETELQGKNSGLVDIQTDGLNNNNNNGPKNLNMAGAGFQARPSS